MGTFDDDFRFGAHGVRLVTSRLAAAGVRVGDVQEDPEWQALGVDLLCEQRRLLVAAEVKFERKDTGNFALESISNTRSGSPGWWLTSHAHLVLYGFHDSREWWVLHLPTLRRSVRDGRWRALRSVQARTTGAYATSCRLLPIHEAIHLGGAARLAGSLPKRFLADAPRLGPSARGARMPPGTCQLRRCPRCSGGRP